MEEENILTVYPFVLSVSICVHLRFHSLLSLLLDSTLRLVSFFCEKLSDHSFLLVI
jgi:hypothetical protein